MADKRIVWQHPDGHLEFTQPGYSAMPGESEGQWLDGVALDTKAKVPHLADAVRLPDIDVAGLPSSRRFRNHWRHVAGAVAPDLGLSRSQVLGEVRAERDGRLDKSDKVKSKLDDVGTGQQKQAYVQYRNALRDLPATVETELNALTTIAALAAYNPTWPTEPNGV